MEIILCLEVIDIIFSGLNIFSLSHVAFYSALSRFPSPWLLFIFFFGFLFSDFILTYLVGVFVFVCVCILFVWYILYLELSIVNLYVDIFHYAWKNLTEDRWILISTSTFSLCFITHHVISGK